MSSKEWVNSPRLAIHLAWLLDQLEPKADAIRELLAGGVEADFFCFSSGSTPNPPALPRVIRDRAAALGIAVAINHYGSERTNS